MTATLLRLFACLPNILRMCGRANPRLPWSAVMAGFLFAAACRTDETLPVAPFTPGDATLLSTNSPGKDEDPFVLRARDGSIVVAWFSERNGNSDIYITRTVDGRNWTPAQRVTTDAGGDFYPNLYQDDQGTFHLTWFRWTALYSGHIMYNTSSDGLTWNTAAEIQATKMLNVDDWVPTITMASDGTVLIYFVSKLRNTTNQQNDIYLAAKQPDNAAFDAVVGASGINLPTAHDHLPFIARTGSGYTLVWVRYDLTEETPWLNPKSDLYYSTSADGVTWATPAKLTTDAGNVVNLYPALYADLDGVWSLLWLSTRTGGALPFELPVTGLAQYPTGVTGDAALGAGYSHRIAATSRPGTFMGVWVAGPDGAQDILYRVFER